MTGPLNLYPTINYTENESNVSHQSDPRNWAHPGFDQSGYLSELIPVETPAQRESPMIRPIDLLQQIPTQQLLLEPQAQLIHQLFSPVSQYLPISPPEFQALTPLSMSSDDPEQILLENHPLSTNLAQHDWDISQDFSIFPFDLQVSYDQEVSAKEVKVWGVSDDFQQTRSVGKRLSMNQNRRVERNDTVGQKRKREFRCSDCLKVLGRKQDLDRHIKSVHHSERPYSCEYCFKQFSRKDALNRHKSNRSRSHNLIRCLSSKRQY